MTNPAHRSADARSGAEVWATLRDTTGTLGLVLDEYLVTRYNHLLLLYPSAEALRGRLDAVAARYAENSFFHFCRFLLVLDRLHTGEKPDARTTHDHAVVQRLENAIVDRIPSEGEAAIDAYSIVRDLARFEKEVAEGTGAGAVYEFTLRLREQQLLKAQFEAYKRWLVIAPPELILVAALLCELSSALEVPEERAPTAARMATMSRLAARAAALERPVPRPRGSFDPDRPLVVTETGIVLVSGKARTSNEAAKNADAEARTPPRPTGNTAETKVDGERSAPGDSVAGPAPDPQELLPSQGDWYRQIEVLIKRVLETHAARGLTINLAGRDVAAGNVENRH